MSYVVTYCSQVYEFSDIEIICGQKSGFRLETLSFRYQPVDHLATPMDHQWAMKDSLTMTAVGDCAAPS